MNRELLKPFLHGQLIIGKSKNDKAQYGLIGLACLLNIVWPIQHSIAVRNTLLAIILMMGFALWRHTQAKPLIPRELKFSSVLYAILSFWLLATILLADEKLNSLDQYRGEWVMATLALLAGLTLGRITPDRKPIPLITALTFALCFPGLLILGNALWAITVTQNLPLWDAPLLGRTSASQVTNILYGFLIADVLARSDSKTPLLPLSSPALLLSIILTLMVTYLLNTRNGTIEILLITIFSTLIFGWQQRRRIKISWLILGAVIVTLALGSFARLSYKADNRWLAFNESIRIACDTEHNKAWLDTDLPLPLMSNGQPVDHSAYMRLAWAREGALAIRDYPFGVGFGRNAFGHAMKRKYGRGAGHSHSSLIDFTLSGGIPGMLLWLGFSGVLISFGWQAYRKKGSPIGLALVFLITSNLLRMIMDSNLRDHGLEQYLFLVATLAALTAHEYKQS